MAEAEVIGYISAPTFAGKAAAEGQWCRGGRPRWSTTAETAHAHCRAIERAGWRDGGRGRDCYVVAVSREADGRISVHAGGQRGTGLHLDGTAALPVGCTNHVDDAIIWLQSRSHRWQRSHLGEELRGTWKTT